MSIPGVVSECFYPLYFLLRSCCFFSCLHCMVTMSPSGMCLTWRCWFLHVMALCRQVISSTLGVQACSVYMYVSLRYVTLCYVVFVTREVSTLFVGELCYQICDLSWFFYWSSKHHGQVFVLWRLASFIVAYLAQCPVWLDYVQRYEVCGMGVIQ